jgi:hypothetical protein
LFPGGINLRRHLRAKPLLVLHHHFLFTHSHFLFAPVLFEHDERLRPFK